MLRPQRAVSPLLHPTSRLYFLCCANTRVPGVRPRLLWRLAPYSVFSRILRVPLFQIHIERIASTVQQFYAPLFLGTTGVVSHPPLTITVTYAQCPGSLSSKLQTGCHTSEWFNASVRSLQPFLWVRSRLYVIRRNSRYAIHIVFHSPTWPFCHRFRKRFSLFPARWAAHFSYRNGDLPGLRFSQFTPAVSLGVCAHTSVIRRFLQVAPALRFAYIAALT